MSQCAGSPRGRIFRRRRLYRKFEQSISRLLSRDRQPRPSTRRAGCGKSWSTPAFSTRGQAFLESLSAIDILVLNQREADLLVPSLVARAGEGGPALALASGEEVPALAARGLVGGGFEMGIAAYLGSVTRLGPDFVVITDGARGAFVGSATEILFAPALKSKVVGTAGAGDAFGATFTTYLALDHSVQEALQAATINSASVVGHIDTQTGLLRRPELDQRLAAKPAQSNVRRWAV
jgi:ribokinase